MVNAREYLDENYPKEKRSEVQEIYLNEPSLEGELDLKDFAHYFEVKVYLSLQVDETKLAIKNKGEKVKIIKLKNAQEWLESQEEYNTKEKREKITELFIYSKELEGTLDLNDFVNLEKIYCHDNKLTSLDLTNCEKLKLIWCFVNQLTNLSLSQNCSNLTELSCYNNLLTKLDFSVLNPEKLKSLQIEDNNFSESDLSIFSSFTNLEGLYIGSVEERKINQNIYNRFYGSLESLKNLTKLQSLSISNTDINSGAEYLPTSVETIFFSIEKRPNSEIKEIAEYLADVSKYLQRRFPTKEDREKVEELDISWKFHLKGELDLSDFVNLKKLNCSLNELTNITLPADPTNLRILNLSRNDFNQDLAFLTLATNLEALDLTGGKFTGSLDCLSGMNNLRKLDISSTDINEVNIDKLPESLEKIEYSTGYRSTGELTKIVSQLEEYEWKDIHPDFILELRRKWEKLGFNREQTQEWIKVGLEAKDYNFVSWLREGIKFTPQEFLELDITSFNFDELSIQEDNQEQNWQNIFPSFTEELINQWKVQGFTYQQAKEWINTGLKPTDHNFCAWLRDTQHLTPEQVLNHHNLEQLNQEFFTWWQEQQKAQVEQVSK